MPKYTIGEKNRIAAEAFDTEKVQLVCAKHNYLAGKLPPETHGCQQCWFSFYIWDIATTPPHLRQERIDQLEEVIHHAVEYEQKGQFNDELYLPGDPRFKVEIGTEEEGAS